MKINKIFPKNRKGDKIISVYWFAILFMVAAAVVYMVAIFYGAPKNIQEQEGKILASKVAECISQGGYLKEGILGNDDFRNNFLSECDINFEVENVHDWKDKPQYYLEVAIHKFDSDLPENTGEKVFNFSAGNMNLKQDYLLRHTERERAGRNIDMVVLHYSATPTAQRTVEVLEQRKLSIHYIVDKDGSIVSSQNTVSSGVVDEEKEALHAGCRTRDSDGEPGETRPSCRGSMPAPGEMCCVNVNPRSIGIEIVNMGNEEYPPEQIAALEILVSDIVSRYDIPLDNIVGHDEVSPGYKLDPGPLFPWEEFLVNIQNDGEETGLGRSFYAIDKTNNPYVIKILPLIGKGEKNEA